MRPGTGNEYRAIVAPSSLVCARLFAVDKSVLQATNGSLFLAYVPEEESELSRRTKSNTNDEQSTCKAIGSEPARPRASPEVSCGDRR